VNYRGGEVVVRVEVVFVEESSIVGRNPIQQRELGQDQWLGVDLEDGNRLLDRGQPQKRTP
jgi:hypothetical protein